MSSSASVSGSRTDPGFLRARRLSLGAVMFCYLFYDTGRQTFGFAIPGMQAELGLSKQTLAFLARRHKELPFAELTSDPLPLERFDDALELARTRRWQRVAIRP